MNVPTIASTITNATGAPGPHGFTLLGHDSNALIIAFVFAIIAAALYEWVMTLLRAVTKRIPFLILQIARISVPRRRREDLYEMWHSELWEILGGRKTPRRKGALRRFQKGMSYAIQLAIFGARSTSKARAEAEVEAEAAAEKGSAPERGKDDSIVRDFLGWFIESGGRYRNLASVLILAGTGAMGTVVVTSDGGNISVGALLASLGPFSLAGLAVGYGYLRSVSKSRDGGKN